MIGVFDSGYGGLTILRALLTELPSYNYTYVADNQRAPYGDRSAEEIYEFTRQGVAYLFKQGSPLVILACNTASAVALRKMQQDWLPAHYPERRILGILVPTVEQITGVPWARAASHLTAVGTVTVGVLATPQTVASGAYETEVHKRNPSLQVVQQACPGLVPAIEHNATPEEIAALVREYVTQLLQRSSTPPQAVLLGCTHFELIAEVIRQHVPSPTRLYHQPSIVAKSLAEYLQRHAALEQSLAKHQQRTYLTTGDPARTSQHAARYFGEVVTFKNITL